MWQRIQTIYLVLAVAFCAVCLCLPIAHIATEDTLTQSTVFNLWTVAPDGTKTLPALNIVGFVILLFTCTMGSCTIGLFRNRKLQASLCMLCIVDMIIWIGLFCVNAFSGLIDNGGEMKPAYAACFPFVAMIFFFLARKAILKDEALVRSMDRIR